MEITKIAAANLDVSNTCSSCRTRRRVHIQAPMGFQWFSTSKTCEPANKDFSMRCRGIWWLYDFLLDAIFILKTGIHYMTFTPDFSYFSLNLQSGRVNCRKSEPACRFWPVWFNVFQHQNIIPTKPYQACLCLLHSEQLQSLIACDPQLFNALYRVFLCSHLQSRQVYDATVLQICSEVV